jgi:hypothetical protein
MKLLIILLLIFPLTAICQNVDNPKMKTFSLGLILSPDYCYRNIETDASYKWVKDLRDSREIPKFGYSAGLSAALLISKKISFEVGVLFSDKGYKTEKLDLVYSTSVDPRYGFKSTGGLPIKARVNYHFHYIDIPLKVDYFILTGGLKIYCTVGISSNLFLSQTNTITMEFNDGRTETNTSRGDSGFNRINLMAMGGLGIKYNFQNKFYIKMEPIFKYSMPSIIDTVIKGYLYSAGLNIGIYYQL